MIIKNNISKRGKVLLLLIAFILTSLLSFALGVLLLKNGTLRKWYDDIEALISYDQKIKIDNVKGVTTIDTIKLRLSKKNFNKVSSLRNKIFFTPKNLLNYNFQWQGERPWIKSKIQLNNKDFKGEIKLIGLNSDHYREGTNWSTRIKIKDNQFIYGFSKFNLLNPYSRGYFIDLYYNEVNRKQNGLYIPSRPIITQLGGEKMLQLFEPFFSKELIEYNHHKDFLIMNEDSTDKKGKTHLRIIHPNLAKLSIEQQRIYKFYENEFQNSRLLNYVNNSDLILQYAIGINTGNNFHHIGFNTYYYADPMLGELRTFIREIDVAGNTPINLMHSIQKLKINRPDSTEIKQKIYAKTISINSLTFNTLLNQSKELKNLYYQCERIIPRSFIYTKKMNTPLIYQKNIKRSYTLKKRKLNYIKSQIIKNKTVIFSEEDSIVFMPNTQIRLINAHIIYKGYLTNNKKLSFKLDKNSSIIFQRCNINLSNTTFKGGGTNTGNQLQNRQISSPYNFVECNVNLSNCSFMQNDSGDDLVNFYRSNVKLQNLSVSNAKYDGLDFDWCIGEITNSSITNCGNDGLDFAGSRYKIENTFLKNCGDKCISIGEKSTINTQNISLGKSEIGIAVKDESTIKFSRINSENNSVDFVAYSKKAQYGISKVIDFTNQLSKLSYLIESDVSVLSPKKDIQRVSEISNMMYGKKYGKASVR